MPGEGRPQSPAPAPFQGVRDYARGVVDAAGRVISAPVNPLGTAEAVGAMASGAVAQPIASVAGIGTEAARGLGLTDARGEDVAQRVQNAISYQPRSESGRAQIGLAGAATAPITESGADIALAPLLAGESQAVRVPSNAARTAGARRVLPGASREVVESRPPARPVSGAAAAERTAGLAKVSDESPTVAQLSVDAKAAYKRAEDAGVKLSEKSFTGLKDSIVKEIGERVDPTLHPDTTAALKRITDTTGDISLEKLDSLRQIASDAKGAVKPADQALAAKMVETIDEYVDGISAKDVTRGDASGAAALKEARSLYTRQKKGEEIAEVFRRAEIKAGANYTQSGLENALRGEFKALALNQKKLRRFNPQERAAIERVAKGGKAENALRFLGKFAPTGIVSAALGGGLGAMVVGPAGAALPLAGLAGRAAATRMTLRNARNVDEMVRRGPPSARQMLEQRMLKKQPEVSD
jgi:hypothetical protein